MSKSEQAIVVKQKVQIEFGNKALIQPYTKITKERFCETMIIENLNIRLSKTRTSSQQNSQ